MRARTQSVLRQHVPAGIMRPRVASLWRPRREPQQRQLRDASGGESGPAAAVGKPRRRQYVLRCHGQLAPGDAVARARPFIAGGVCQVACELGHRLLRRQRDSAGGGNQQQRSGHIRVGLRLREQLHARADDTWHFGFLSPEPRVAADKRAARLQPRVPKELPPQRVRRRGGRRVRAAARGCRQHEQLHVSDGAEVACACQGGRHPSGGLRPDGHARQREL